MCPIGVKSSTKNDQTSQEIAKFWGLLIGVNEYQSQDLNSLNYSAADCQDLSKALEEVTQEFPQRELLTHHDYALNSPTLKVVRENLKRIASEATEKDKVVFYFSGHGVLEPDTEQAVLCLQDTNFDDLIGTGLVISEVLELLGNCAASVQFIWLDACHSGGLNWQSSLNNPTPQLIQRLQEQATYNQGFYALLSCDRAQQSWEFPEIGHGIFTYYLIRGLQGNAANENGLIEADQLYRYIYHQTLQYIDQTNQQLRLINQQKRNRGEAKIQSEYPLQTPKRIVEGVGELILGRTPQSQSSVYPRRALVIEPPPQTQTSLELGKVLRGRSQFELNYCLPNQASSLQLQQEIQTCLQLEHQEENETVLLYLRGNVEIEETGTVYFTFGEQNRISLSWLGKQLARASHAQQIIILDCGDTAYLNQCLEELKLGTDYGQCLIVASSGEEAPDRFIKAVLETLTVEQVGLSVASWIYQLKAHLATTTIPLEIWLSGGRGVIEIVPETQTGTAVNLDLGLCPYVGLRAFREEDTAYFYGREGFTQKLIAELYHRSFLAVVGASGSGKSSVVQAGVIAQLKQGKQLPGSEQWRICYFRPGEHPLNSLIQSLAEETEEQNQLEGLLYQGVEGLVCWLRACSEPMVVFVVDQFEELFTLASPVERSQFLELLLGVINYASDRAKLLITLRGDFVTYCLEFSELAALLQQASFFVSPILSEADYRNVIINPAKSVGLQVEPALVEILLQDIGTATGKLPLLEFVLEQLWQYRQQGILTLEAYQNQIGGLEGALEKKANAVYESLDAEARRCAQWIFLALTQVGEEMADTSRRISKRDLIVSKYPSTLVERTLQTLVEANLVVVDLDHPQTPEGSSKGEDNPLPASQPLSEFPLETSIEIAHEILIHHWSTLRWWLEQNRNRLQLQRQLEQAAKLWHNNDQNPDYLWQGARLAQAEEIYIKSTDELSPQVQEFIEAGIAQRDAAQRQAQRRLRRAQVAAATISILGIMATALGGFAYWQRQETLISQVQTLNASAEALFDSDQPLQALATSLEAEQQLGEITFSSQELEWETASTLQNLLHHTHARNRLSGHTETVQAVDVSPDETLMVSASWDGTIKLWEANGELITTLEEHQGEVMDVHFHPEGERFASVGLDGTVKWWDTEGTLINRITTNQALNQIRFSPNGDTMITAGEDGAIALWDDDGNQQEAFIAHEEGVNRLSFSPDGQFLVSASQQSSVVKVWDTEGNLLEELGDYEDGISDVAVSPDNESIAIATLSGEIQIKDRNGNGNIDLPKQENAIMSVGFMPNGKVVTADAEGTIKAWSLDGKQRSSEVSLTAHQGAVRDFSFFPEQNILVSASDDQTLRTWELPDSENASHEGEIYTVAFSPEDQQVATAGWDGQINLWQDQELTKTLEDHNESINSLSFSPDGNYLASGSADTTLKIWDLQNETQQTLRDHQDLVTSVDFSTENQLLASGSDDETVRIWDYRGERQEEWVAHEGGVTSVRFAPQGDYLASTGYDGKVKLWETDGTLKKTLPAQEPAVSEIAFSPDGTLLASAGWDNTIQIWSDGELLETLVGHDQGVTSLSFTPEGNILASGSSDGTVKLWNPETGDNLATLEGELPLHSINFNPQGNQLVAGGSNPHLKWWEFDLASLREKGCDRASDYLTTSDPDSSLCEG
ncbi:hypothetical protein FRE64_09560 [Euhalothece natronophila Z-M001]|uniref:Uncharacterized protein n=1 Tax=Euhalothece natronophila Z-M001 TaxID=522448 RepID=A0A5B8NLK4_9CHRO|nr:caspase family protein [Euhalothece natronophila]QDZ40173.1 hypothetical protein FRE64_09560 [Euhalothece natronophila Z-M001]